MTKQTNKHQKYGKTNNNKKQHKYIYIYKRQQTKTNDKNKTTHKKTKPLTKLSKIKQRKD